MFTMDTESGFDDAVFITSAYGLGEARRAGRGQPRRVLRLQARAARRAARRSSSAGVGGKATKMVYTDDADRRPDDRVRRRRRRPSGALLSLTDDEVEELARHALTIEEHYGRPMDIEWGKDGVDGELYILQARPETVKSRPTGDAASGSRCERASGAEVLVEGRAIGQKIGAGAVRVLTSVDADARVQRGRGAGRRHDRPRLGADHEARRGDRHQPRRPHLPRRDHRPRARHPGRGRHRRRRPATLADGREVTVSCAEGDTGFVYDGAARLHGRARPSSTTMPDIAGQDHDERRHAGPGVRVLPAAATRASGWPGWSSSSTGRSASTPRRCSSSSRPSSDADLKPRDRGADRGVPRPARVLRAARRRGRLDARRRVRAAPGDRADVATSSPTSTPTCVGGELYEPHEENPMIGYRGASRYLSRGVRRLLRDGVRGAAATCATRWA